MTQTTQTKRMHREVRDTVKGLREYADPKPSFKIEYGKHLKITWDMTNDDGESVTVQYFMGLTPSDYRWRQNHQKSLRKVFRQNNISTEVISICPLGDRDKTC